MEKLGFVVKTDNNDTHSWDFVFQLCETGQSAGYEIQIFAMMNGIYYLLQGKSKKDEPDPRKIMIEKIMDKGAKIMVFNVSALERGFEGVKPFIDGIKLGGMVDLANMIGNCDRLICL